MVPTGTKVDPLRVNLVPEVLTYPVDEDPDAVVVVDLVLDVALDEVVVVAFEVVVVVAFEVVVDVLAVVEEVFEAVELAVPGTHC